MEKLAQKYANDNESDCETYNSDLDELFGLPTGVVELLSNEHVNDAKKKRMGDRLPTRRPDPNVYNRNALLARENRKRKKAHVETLEKCLEECKRVNIKLLDALKRERKMTRRLEREKLYYKNIVTNRTEIVSLVSALNGRLRETATPQNCINLNQTSPTQDSLYSYSGSSSYETEYPVYAFDYSDNELERPVAFDDTWNDILHDKTFGLAEEFDQLSSDIDTNKGALLNVQKERYVTPPDNNNEAKEAAGVCLHITGGKVSIEFCPTCHWSANQALPNQLLQGDLIESLHMDSTGAQAQLEICHLKRSFVVLVVIGSSLKQRVFLKSIVPKLEK